MKVFLDKIGFCAFCSLSLTMLHFSSVAIGKRYNLFRQHTSIPIAISHPQLPTFSTNTNTHFSRTRPNDGDRHRVSRTREEIRSAPSQSNAPTLEPFRSSTNYNKTLTPLSFPLPSFYPPTPFTKLRFAAMIFRRVQSVRTCSTSSERIVLCSKTK